MGLDSIWVLKKNPKTNRTTYNRDTPLEPFRNPPALISAGFVNKVDNLFEKVRK